MFIIQPDQLAKAGNLFQLSSGSAITDVYSIGEALTTNDFTATKPTLIVVNPAGYGYDMYFLNLIVAQSLTVAGGIVRSMQATDTGNRWSAGVTQRTPVPLNPEGRVSQALCFMAIVGTLLTATAATGSVKYFGERATDFAVGTGIQAKDEWDWGGGLVLTPGYSWLFYIGAVTTAPSFTFEINYIEKAR